MPLSFLNPFFDAVFGFLLSWPPIGAVALFSIVVSIITVVVYKVFSNQSEMKRIKDEMGEFQKKMKASRDDPKKVLELQKKSMALNGEYMRHSMRPMFVTFLPILLLFGWMNAHFQYEPLFPGSTFSLTAQLEKDVVGNVSIEVPEGLVVVNGSVQEVREQELPQGFFGRLFGSKRFERVAVFELKGDEGNYLVTLRKGDQAVDASVMISSGRWYADVSQALKNVIFKGVTLGNAPLLVFWKFGWLGTYIILVMVVSTLLRKVLKVY